jgi:hypothetical protein
LLVESSLISDPTWHCTGSATAARRRTPTRARRTGDRPFSIRILPRALGSEILFWTIIGLKRVFVVLWRAKVNSSPALNFFKISQD